TPTSTATTAGPTAATTTPTPTATATTAGPTAATTTPTPTSTATTVGPTAETATPTATATIGPDDRPAASFSSPEYLFTTDQATVTITATLSKATEFAVTLQYQVSLVPQVQGQTVAGDIVLQETIQFAPGETSKAITIALRPEWIAEAPTTLLVELTSLDSHVVIGGGATALLIIADQQANRLYLPLIQQ
ncbi:MAG: hypothetical protein KF832_03505, partial [Caldilineaceae bacterium]|nr:hypothetical protein [Caldilineaceae bacterium]